MPLYTFKGGTDGAVPRAELIQGRGSDTSFYGTTSSGGGPADVGGSNNSGTIFRFSPGNPSSVAILHAFKPAVQSAEGNAPLAGLAFGPDTRSLSFYGTTYLGGNDNIGTIYQILVSLGPQLNTVFSFPLDSTLVVSQPWRALTHLLPVYRLSPALSMLPPTLTTGVLAILFKRQTSRRHMALPAYLQVLTSIPDLVLSSETGPRPSLAITRFFYPLLTPLEQEQLAYFFIFSRRCLLSRAATRRLALKDSLSFIKYKRMEIQRATARRDSPRGSR